LAAASAGPAPGAVCSFDQSTVIRTKSG
jgi:hypothetical protein